MCYTIERDCFYPNIFPCTVGKQICDWTGLHNAWCSALWQKFSWPVSFGPGYCESATANKVVSRGIWRSLHHSPTVLTPEYILELLQFPVQMNEDERRTADMFREFIGSCFALDIVWGYRAYSMCNSPNFSECVAASSWLDISYPPAILRI